MVNVLHLNFTPSCTHCYLLENWGSNLILFTVFGTGLYTPSVFSKGILNELWLVEFSLQLRELALLVLLLLRFPMPKPLQTWKLNGYARHILNFSGSLGTVTQRLNGIKPGAVLNILLTTCPRSYALPDSILSSLRNRTSHPLLPSSVEWGVLTSWPQMVSCLCCQNRQTEFSHLFFQQCNGKHQGLGPWKWWKTYSNVYRANTTVHHAALFVLEERGFINNKVSPCGRHIWVTKYQS